MTARRRRHPAAAARVLTAGLSTAAAFGIVAALAHDSQRQETTSPDRSVEVRIGEDVDEDQARQAIESWLEGQPSLDRDGSLTVVEGPVDTVSQPS
ncbi:MAG TPA: hypothetical protein VK875_06935 [Euzebyales bacterium]|nr:hypothetical protein [Euzebyales bacterium]